MPDLESLERSVDRLREGWSRYRQTASDVLIRDGLILRFKFTYEISCKVLRQSMDVTSANPGRPVAMSFQDQISAGKKLRLLASDWSMWRTFRAMRVRASGAYSDDVALQVVAPIPEFITEAAYLLQRLKNIGKVRSKEK